MNKPAHLYRPGTCGLKLDRDNARFYGQRGAPRPQRHFIEGEWLTFGEMAVRVGRAGSSTGRLYRKMRAEHGEVKWEHLRRNKP